MWSHRRLHKQIEDLDGTLMRSHRHLNTQIEELDTQIEKLDTQIKELAINQQRR